jgi:hypothetical protein
MFIERCNIQLFAKYKNNILNTIIFQKLFF